MNDVERNEPKLRFPGYTAPWEQRKFGELVLIERGGSPRPIDDYITDSSDGLNWVKIGDAPEHGRYINSTKEKIKPEGLSKTRQVQPGDLILSNSMSFGRPYIMGIHGCIHDGWLLIRDEHEKFDLTFLCHMLGTEQMLDQYRMYAAGSTVNNLNKELVGNTTVSIPAKAEQKLIGQFFEQVDDIITLHQRKCDEIKAYKKGLLQQMFPQPGERFPRVRFLGYNDPWEQHKLSEMSYFITKGATPTTYGFDWADKGIPFFRNDAIKDNQFVYGDYSYISVEAHEALIRSEIKQDDILVAITGDIGKVGIVPQGIEKANINQHTARVRIIRNAVPYFVYQSLAREEQQMNYKKIKTGLSMPQLSLEQIRDTLILCPSLEEQTKIANVLSCFDNLITLHQRKCDELKKYKVGLMQKMFV